MPRLDWQGVRAVSPTPIRPLGNIQVVDLTTEIAGPYCTKLFADAGAEVIKVEPPTGDPLRRYAATVDLPPGEDGVLFCYLNAGKKSIVALPGDAGLEPLFAGADLIVEDLPAGAIDVAAVRARHPHLVVVSITPFGRHGPLAGRAATDLTLQAESGAILFKGARDRPPVMAGGRISEFLGGLFAAPGALAAVQRARLSGQGEHIDVAIHDVMAIAGSNYAHLAHEIQGRPQIVAPARYLDTPGIETAMDGMVAFNTNTGHMLQLFLLLVERPDLMEDPAYSAMHSRVAMGAEWQRIIDDWVGKRTVSEVVDAAVALRVPVAPVHDAETIVHDEHLVARGVFMDDGQGRLHPRPPYLIDGQTMGVTTAAPRLGDHDDVVLARSQRPRAQAAKRDGGTDLPLAALKVVDLTSWWVGALATQTLAMLGADVVHVEGVSHPDGMRLTGVTYAKSEDWWEWGHMFSAANTTKRGITLDIGTPAGRALLDRLIEWGDVLVENFSPRVAESWGLTPEAVHACNSRIVYQRMPAYGLTGPWRDRPAFAQTVEPMSTMASITGYRDAMPLAKGGLADSVAGMHGAWAAIVALAEQRNRGSGVFVEAVMLEAALNVSAQPLLEYTAYGRVMTRLGNQSSHAAPQGVYGCAGTEQWLAISVTDNDQWKALAELVGGRDLASSPRYETAADRHRHHDELDALLKGWAATRDAQQTSKLLASLSIPAAACWDHRLLDEHPQYRARKLFSCVDHPVVGRYHAPGLPYRFESVETWVRTPAPTFGQHNDEVLRDIVGLDEHEIENLASAGVIANRPRGLS
jgi:crotonobetainyl-CoA:carnitine CoA-transferase CaiB-like acyl-CoA transferase